MNNIDNLIVCLAIVSCIMFTASVIIGVYVIMIIKLFRDDIKKEKTFDKEMKQISGNNDDADKTYDEIEKRHRLQDFLKKTSLERAKTNRKYSETETINSGEIIEKINETVEEPESYKKGYDDFNKSLNSFCEPLVNNQEEEPEKSVKEELESLSILNFDKDDIPYQSKIERSIEETDTNLSFIEDEPTVDPFIEDTEVIFDTPIKKLNTAEFRTLSKDEQLQYALNIAKDKYSVENLPEELKEQLYSKNLEKFCSNVSEFGDNKKVDVVKDSDTGQFKFDFETPVADIYKCNHGNNYYNQGYQL